MTLLLQGSAADFVLLKLKLVDDPTVQMSQQKKKILYRIQRQIEQSLQVIDALI
jgi:hypothetical protein